MTDTLRDRFATLDRLPVPDLWSDVLERAAVPATAVTGVTRPAIPRLRTRRLLLVALALAAGVLAVGVLAGGLRSGPPPILVVTGPTGGTPGDLVLVRPGEAPLDLATGVYGARLSADGRWALARRDDGVVLVGTDGTTRALGAGWLPDLEAWGPTGAVGAFVTEDGITLVAPDDGSARTVPTRLTGSSYVRRVAVTWSPDGHRLLASVWRYRGDAPEREVLVVEVPDGAATPLAEGLVLESEAVWSHGGDRVAFVARQLDPGNELVVVDLASGRRSVLTDHVAGGPLAFTADDTGVHWTAQVPDGIEIRRVRAVGGEVTVVARLRPGGPVVFAPDGRRAAWLDPEPVAEPGAVLRILDLELGTSRIIATGLDAEAPGPDWSPDGRWLAVARHVPPSLVAIRVDGGEVRELHPRRTPAGPPIRGTTVLEAWDW